MDTQPSLKLSKKQRISLYKKWWEHYTYMDQGDSYFPDNPNLSNTLYITYLVFPQSFDNKTLLYIIDKYRPRFVIWAQKRGKKNGGWPKEQNRTRVIKEFLARGFIHTSDVPYIAGKYPVITLVGELQWPVSFDLHQEALDISKRFGITGYTKCPIPKQ